MQSLTECSAPLLLQPSPESTSWVAEESWALYAALHANLCYAYLELGEHAQALRAAQVGAAVQI